MSVSTPAPVLRLASGPLAGKVVEIASTLRLGRHPFNELSLGDPGISRYHCWILVRDGNAAIEDLASANGTFVNGQRLKLRQVLRTGDRLRIGSTEFVFSEAG